MLLANKKPSELTRRALSVVDDETLAVTRRIIAEIEEDGEPAVRRWVQKLDGLDEAEPLALRPAQLEAARDRLPTAQIDLLRRTAARIERFARAQMGAVKNVEVEIPGGRAGHTALPVASAGCYAPGGRFPLPSSVLMTAVTARVAGVQEVWVASPKPQPITLAAASVAGADGLLCAGGAPALAALAFGAGELPRCDLLVGPGNRWVTAAKYELARRVGIDMLAGPSELVVLADQTADPAWVAADLLAQAEHDEDALPVLVTTSAALADEVRTHLATQLALVATRAIAEVSLSRGFTLVAGDIQEAIALADALAPEHLQIVTEDSEAVAARCRHAGAIFIGPGSAEVLGDYGVGPNHSLPTGQGSRFSGGLSVKHFLRLRTYITIADPQAARGAYADAAQLARLEGLEGHAAAAQKRLDALVD